MREKTPDIPDIRDVFEKKESILKASKKMLRCKYAVHLEEVGCLISCQNRNYLKYYDIKLISIINLVNK